MRSISKIAALLSALWLAAFAALAQPQAWPTKPIRIINPFPAGGGTDTFARPLAAKLSQSLGQSLYIEYALWAIKGTPREIVDRFYAETVKVLEQKDIEDIWLAAASDTGGMPPDQFGAFVNKEIVRWAKVVKDAGVKLDP